MSIAGIIVIVLIGLAAIAVSAYKMRSDPEDLTADIPQPHPASLEEWTAEDILRREG